MATMTISRPLISSPLSGSSNSSRGTAATQRITPRPNSQFQSSRALRPFPSIAHSFKQANSSTQPGCKPIKLIVPPENFKCTFMLNLTQAEFSRQE